MTPTRGSLSDRGPAPGNLEVPPSDRSPHRRLVRDVLSWARREAGLRTSQLPEHEIAAEHGASRIVGHRLASSAWSNWAYASFLAVVVATIALLALDARTAGGLIAVVRIGGFGSAFALGLVAWSIWRKARLPLDILVLRGPRIISRKRLAAQFLTRPREHQAAELWVVSRMGFSKGALELARTASVRCLVPGPRGAFVDAVAEPGTATPVKAA